MHGQAFPCSGAGHGSTRDAGSCNHTPCDFVALRLQFRTSRRYQRHCETETSTINMWQQQYRQFHVDLEISSKQYDGCLTADAVSSVLSEAAPIRPAMHAAQ